MSNFIDQEDYQNGIRFVFNNLPNNRSDSTLLNIPIGFHYQPYRQNEELPILEYDPVQCKQCKAYLNPFNLLNFKTKIWDCQFCNTKNPFSTFYAQNISEEMLPTELQQQFTTVEYKLNKKETSFPYFLFIIDIAIEEEELIAVKENIQQVINSLPTDCHVGLISYGTNIQVYELGFQDYPVSYNFKGDINYKPIEIQELLGLISINKNQNNVNIINNNQLHRYIVPIKDCEFGLNNILDDLQVDPFGRTATERYSNCGGLALQIGISILETCSHNEPSRIEFFTGGAVTQGPGQIASLSLKEVIRNWIDFEKGHENTKYYKSACEYYEGLALRAAKTGQIIDIFSSSFNQTGIYEMRSLIEKTGGILAVSDSFTTVQFKETLRKLFEIDEQSNLKMCFKGKIELYSSNSIFISGAIGNMISLNIASSNVSQISLYEGNTKTWYIGGMDNNSCYTFILDMNSSSGNIKSGSIQLVTSYISGDRTHRVRVTTVNRKIIGSLSIQNNVSDLIQGIDQEAATVMLAKVAIIKSKSEEYQEVLKWLDKTLIRFLSKVSSFKPNDIQSFRLAAELSLFPQFLFYLRRSPFISHFNSSIDENTFYKLTLLHENVTNCSIMIQPVLLSYTADQSEANPVFLDIINMKNDNVLFLDTFFNIVIWHSEDVCSWRDNGLHLEEDYSNIKLMLESPQDYAQQLLSERIPVPKMISCDAGSGQERHIKSVVDPSNSGSTSKVISDGFSSDDVTLEKFRSYLIKVIVTTIQS